MRIALPLENDQVAHHLGHCPAFLIAEVNDGQVAETTVVPNPRHGPGGPPPVFLARMGVGHVVGWGAPDHLLGFLSSLNIGCTLGAQGNALQVLKDYLAGTLQLTDQDIKLQCQHDDHDHQPAAPKGQG